jgi:putative ribosome biogenesis GTPase RsgA
MTDKIRRYPSIRAFQRNEQQLFIGRETETQQLFNKVISQNITLVFARSGIGKSSLINAG